MYTGVEELKKEEKEELYAAPVIVSILATITDNAVISPSGKEDAIKLAHLRTFTSTYKLHDYYKHVDAHFEENFRKIMNKLPEDFEDKKAYLKEHLINIIVILSKLPKTFVDDLVKSLKSFARHVFRANTSILEHFLLPVVIDEIEKTIK